MTKINYIIGTPNAIAVDSNRFSNLCKTGCRIWDTKLSCPPAHHTFLINQWLPFHVIILWADNDIIANQEFTKVKALNSILKSKLNKLLYQYTNTHVLGSGSCRLCKKCNYPNPCKHPDKMFPSLEACGIDVEAVCKALGHELQWYRKGQQTPYKYGTVVGLIKGSTETRIREQLDKIIEIKTDMPKVELEVFATKTKIMNLFEV